MNLEDDFFDEKNMIKDMLMDTNEPISSIAKEMDMKESELVRKIKEYNLGWVKRRGSKLSRGHASLLRMLKKLVPNEKVVTEHHVGDRLRLDIYCPKYKVGIEYHGRQHFEYVEHFHGNMRGFRESQARDRRKEELCKEQGIALVVFRFNDDLSEDIVFDRILSAIENRPAPIKEETVKRVNKEFQEKMKARRREWNRDRYRAMKERRKK